MPKHKIHVCRFTSWASLLEVCSLGYYYLSSVNHYTQSLGVMKELLNTGVVTGTSSLSLLAEKVLKRILAQVVAQECKLILFHLREREQVVHKAGE